MSDITLIEVGPRDGLQNERTPLDAATRIQLVEHLNDAGLHDIEVGSFVSPQWVPQMAGTEHVIDALARRHFNKIALVPNEKGLERALAHPVETIAIFTAASDTFCQRNINCTIDESLNRFRAVVARALDAGMAVRGYVSCLMACPYEGPTNAEAVIRVTEALLDMGCVEVSLGDTIGVGTARQIAQRIEQVLKVTGTGQIALHLHDTRGQAVSAIDRCLDLGITRFDTSIAGLGGCPYARGASGNVATEDAVYLLEKNGYDTGLDMDRLAETGHWISQHLGRPYTARAGLAHYNTMTLKEGEA